MLKEDALKKIEYYCEKDKSVICPFSNEKRSKERLHDRNSKKVD